ncbi:hypothetical protein ACOMHN_022967 [Nucella lapillus]
MICLCQDLSGSQHASYASYQHQLQSPRWLKVKQDPVRYARWKAQARDSMRKSRLKKKLLSLDGQAVESFYHVPTLEEFSDFQDHN